MCRSAEATLAQLETMSAQNSQAPSPPEMKSKPRNRKPPEKDSVNQFDFEESEVEILSVSCTEGEINAVNNHPNKILVTMKEWERSENVN